MRGLKARLIAGLVIIVPIVVTFLVLRFLIVGVVELLRPVVELFFKDKPPLGLDIALSTAILLALIYIMGLLGTNVVGRRLIQWGEAFFQRIPLVKTIYSASKKVVEALTLPQRAAFRKVVFIEYPRVGLWAIGFVSRTFSDAEGKRFHVVFVPTTPNPTSGYIEIVPVDEVIESGLGVEEGIKMVISGGIVGPERVEAVIASYCKEERTSPLRDC